MKGDIIRLIPRDTSFLSSHNNAMLGYYQQDGITLVVAKILRISKALIRSLSLPYGCELMLVCKQSPATNIKLSSLFEHGLYEVKIRNEGKSNDDSMARYFGRTMLQIPQAYPGSTTQLADNPAENHHVLGLDPRTQASQSLYKEAFLGSAVTSHRQLPTQTPRKPRT